ncbi:Wax ester synthase/diacylglycerol acyltransferase 7 [Cardamine amara subsp. amara]|uniref:Wax ester synthase/diacylglycerol acyltransferase 7 n=1 Tax=Cardamine amara subsp. amara TaxID=228776 RepID=A0ABD1AJN1_CARAN
MKSDPNNLPDRIRFRACVPVNLRSEIGIQPLADMMSKGSKCRWGNYISFLIFPFSIGIETNPLVYLSKAKATMNRKKNSFHATLIYWFIKLILYMVGAKVGAVLFNRPCSTTTMWVSNIVGPVEEVSFQGHPIAYIALSAYGHSQALLIHFISYAEKMVISIAIDPRVIPDPHKLLYEMEESLKAMKATLSEGGLL